MPNPVVHFEINSKNAKKAQEFYKKVFGWKINANNPLKYGLVKAGSRGGIGGGIAQVEKGARGSVTFYIQVKDLKACLKRVERLGGKTVVPPTIILNIVTFALFRDPEGNLIGLVKG